MNPPGHNFRIDRQIAGARLLIGICTCGTRVESTSCGLLNQAINRHYTDVERSRATR